MHNNLTCILRLFAFMQGIYPLGNCTFGDDPSFLQCSQHSRDAGLQPRAVWRNPGAAKLYEHVRTV
jgi:hypothetical protein